MVFFFLSGVSMVHIRKLLPGFTFPLWTLTVHVSLVLWTEAEGQSQVVCSSQPITASVGDDIILPCHMEPPLDAQELTVEWWKPDVTLDPTDPRSDYRYVHRYHDNRDEEDMKMPAYAGRTALVKGDLRHGNVSLRIMNVALWDKGWYRCQIPHLRSAAVIQIVVEPNSVQTWTTQTPMHPRNLLTPCPADAEGGRTNQVSWISAVVACVFLILGFGVGAYLLKDKCQKQNRPEYDITPTAEVPVSTPC